MTMILRVLSHRTMVTAALATAGLVVGAGLAVADTGLPTEVSCAGSTLTVVAPPGNAGNNWGAVRVVGGGHLVVSSLEYAVYDDTADVSLVDEVLSHGVAHENQQRVTCVVASQRATLGDIVPAEFAYPPGTTPADQVTSSLSAVVVPRPSSSTE